jgi:heat shock protein HtpX
MFSTHPATENRIAALHEMADEMGLASPPPVAGARGATAVPKTRRSSSALDPLGRRS